MSRYQIIPVHVFGDDFEGRGGRRGGRGRKMLDRFRQRFSRRGRGGQDQESEDEPEEEEEEDRPRRRKSRGNQMVRRESTELAGRKPRWPAGYFSRQAPVVRAGPDLAVVPRPESGSRAAVVELKPDLFLVGAVPESDCDPEFGIVPFLLPLMVRSGQRALARNRVDQQGKPGRGWRLFRRRDDQDEQEPPESKRVSKPRWLDDDEAEEFGFDLG